MDYFALQDQARRRTGWLVFLTALAVVAVVASIYSIVSFFAIFFLGKEYPPGTATSEMVLDAASEPAVAVFSIGATLFVIFVSMLWKTFRLRDGGPAVALALGARPVDPNTTDVAERRLLNVVEEMAIAAGIRIPRTFILDKEKGLNAFAAGYSPDDAAVTVTAGLLRTLNRDELQGVIGHEFSHILNGDMRLNIRLIGVLAGLLSISTIGWFIVRASLEGSRHRSRNDEKGGGAVAFLFFGAAVWLIGAIGLFFGRLIQCAISRQREYLADASSAQFTRNPEGLASALKCIASAPGGSRMPNTETSEVAHMLFAKGFDSLYATHPPVLSRILRLDPGFDGDLKAFVQRRFRRSRMAEEESKKEQERRTRNILHRAARAAFYIATFDEAYQAIPDATLSALHETLPALAFLFAAVHPRDNGPLDAQAEALVARSPLATIADRHGLDASALLRTWVAQTAGWPPSRLRAGAEIAVATIRPLSPQERDSILATVTEIAKLDRKFTPFETALVMLLRRRLRDAPASLPDTHSAERLLVPANRVLAAIAHFAGGEAARQDAWNAATAAYAPLRGHSPDRSALSDLSLLEAALSALRSLQPLWKQQFMKACAAAVEADGKINEDEANFLAAIADGIAATGWSPDEGR